MKNVASKSSALRGTPVWSRTERITEIAPARPVARRQAETREAAAPPLATVPASAPAARFVGSILVSMSRTLGALVRKDLTTEEVRPLARRVQGQVRSATLPLSNGAAFLTSDFISA